MKYWLVMNLEFNGIECDGHWQRSLVIAETHQDARKLFPKQPDDELDIREISLPDMRRIRKPRRVI